MRGWKDLELVETIYEEEDDDHDHHHDHDHEDHYSSSSLSFSPSLSLSPPTPLQSIAITWSLATGIETDVVIHVQDQSFHLHKDPLTSKSGYLKRHLADTKEISLSPPLKITAETFSSIIDYCYSYQIVITPFNVAALRIAVELLEMTADNGNSDNSLRQKTESYFNTTVTLNREYASIVLRSCLALLPEAEAASLASECIEMLTMSDGSDSVNDWVNELISLSAEDFPTIVDSMHERFTDNHDLLYRIVDLYLQEHTGKITEEEKTRICSSVDCIRLSPHLVLHAVQNPRMPLRFIVRAMLIEQLNTHRSIISATTPTVKTCYPPHTHLRNSNNNTNHRTMTLGTILQRDAALRQAAHLKASMEATSSKIEALEKDLIGMRKFLDSSKKKREATESGRSESFRFSSERKIESEERGSKSTSLRFTDRRGRGALSSSSSSSEISIIESVRTKTEKSFGRKLMNGLKNALRISSAKSKQDTDSMVSSKLDEEGLKDIEEHVAIRVYKEDLPSHRRSRSLV